MKMKKDDFKEKSYWMTTQDYTPGEPLQEDIDVDVAIVGGGFTGLSSAYHIKNAEPNLRVALLESEVVGFGASGRNGGFNSGKNDRFDRSIFCQSQDHPLAAGAVAQPDDQGYPWLHALGRPDL